MFAKRMLAFAMLSRISLATRCSPLQLLARTSGKTSAGLMVASMLKKIGNRVAYYTSLGASDGKDAGLAAHSDAMRMISLNGSQIALKTNRQRQLSN